MINEQTPKPQDYDEDGFLEVFEIFNTIQGEGPFTGHFATFVRLYGCNLQCPFCDTDYTSMRMRMSPVSVVSTIRDMAGRTDSLVVITGGEPFRQNIEPLVTLLLDYGYTVQVESNGTLQPRGAFPFSHERFTLVISPKTGKINPRMAVNAHAYKYVLSHDSVAEDGLPVAALGHPLGNAPHIARPPLGWEGPVYLNPMDAKDPKANHRNLQAVAEIVLNKPGYIMGVQLHKLVGLS